MKKYIQFILALCIGFFYSSCSDDDGDSTTKSDNCVAPDFKENIVGTWQVSFCNQSPTAVTFTSDTIYIDPNGCLISLGGATVLSRSYSIINDTLIYCVYDSTGGKYCSRYNPPIENSCNRIVFPKESSNFPNQTFNRL